MTIYLAVFFGIVIFAITIVFISIPARKEHLSGRDGERRVSGLLSSLKQEDEEVIDDYLASRNKYNTASIQIDHILISHKGIFVIETKDYRGRIYGSIDQNYWTQVLAYGKVKNKLYNPIKQNETHCNYVNRLLDYEYPIFNVVLFNGADISAVKNSGDILFKPSSFVRWYRNLPDSTMMSEHSIRCIKQVLIDEMNNNKITIEEHIQNIKQKH